MKLKKLAAIPATVIEAVIGAIIGAIPAIFKKKPYTLWYWEPPAWKEIGTFSARQCRKAMAELVRLGENPARFSILRKGIKPPAGGPK